MEDDEAEALIMRVRSLIKEADLARASSEDARTRSRVIKHDAQLIRRRIQGGLGYDMGGLPLDTPVLRLGRVSPLAALLAKAS
jgi:hypothetical protein